MKKIIQYFSIIILALAILSLFAYSIRYVTLGGRKLGALSRPLVMFASFPDLVKQVLFSSELRGVPPTYTLKDNSFSELNTLDHNIYATNSFYNLDSKTWEIRLFELNSDSVVHIWKLPEESFYKTKRLYENSRPSGGILLPNRHLVAYLGHSNNLYRLDQNSNIIWHNTDNYFHHSMELDADSNIWVCTALNRKFILANVLEEGEFIDEYLTKIDINNGKVLYNKSVSDILIENNLMNYVYGFTNTNDPNRRNDPLHLNDIQPVLKSSKYMLKDDLFLSFRHRSLVLQYRPTENKIIRLIQGPFLFQHDVDILSDSTIGIFNNNATNIGIFVDNESDEIFSYGNQTDSLTHSEVLVFNIADSTYSSIYKNQFIKADIYTRTEGSYHFLSNGDLYVESQNDSKIYILNDQEIRLQKQLPTEKENLVFMLNLLRIYENINF